MRSVITFLFIACFFNLPAQDQLYREKIKFDYSSSKIPSKSLKQIKGIWDLLPKNTSVELVVVSDKEIKKLDPSAVVTLSRARTEAIQAFLLNQKLALPHNLEPYFHSWIEVDPIPGTKTAFNRIVRDPYKVYSLILNKEVPICYNHTDAERRALNSKLPTVVAIDPSKTTTVEVPWRVKVEIPANAFVLPPEKRSAEVIIKLWDFISTTDIVVAGLSTISAGRLLETGGMIYITAECEGECLRLRRDIKIHIRFANQENYERMQIFKGIPQHSSIDWKEYTPSTLVSPLSPENPDSFEDSTDVSYYNLESTGLGWINCDRFYQAGERINVSYTVEKNFKGTAMLVFADIKSMLEGEVTNAKENNVQFSNVPKGMGATLFVFAFTKDKKVIYTMKAVILGQAPDEIPVPKVVSLNEFKEEIRSNSVIQ